MLTRPLSKMGPIFGFFSPIQALLSPQPYKPSFSYSIVLNIHMTYTFNTSPKVCTPRGQDFLTILSSKGRRMAVRQKFHFLNIAQPQAKPFSNSHGLNLNGSVTGSNIQTRTANGLRINFSVGFIYWHRSVYQVRTENGQSIIKNLQGKKQMQQQIKIEWDMSLPEDQSGNGLKTGSWTIHENLLYAIFVTQNKATMVSKRKRKNLRIFDRMADFVASRNSLQCRSHHQKLIQKFMEIKNIINAFKKYFGNQYFREQTMLYSSKKSSTESHSTKSIQNINSQILPEEEEPVQDQRAESGSCGEEEMKAPDVVRSEDDEERLNAVASSCRTEENLQSTCPFGYYFSNGFVPFPIYGFYPACGYQTI